MNIKKMIAWLPKLAFWAIFFLASVVSYAIIVTLFGRLDLVAIWMYPFIAFGLIWSLAAGTLLPILIGLEQIYNWIVKE